MTAEPVTRSREHLVEGLYRLGRILHNSAVDTIYETTFGDEEAPAVIRIQRGGTADAGRLLAHWHKAVEFSHANLIKVYAAGSSVLDEIPVIYVVMQRADESLARVLAERALSEQAVTDMLTPILSALSYLHKNGNAHSGLKPSNVLAVGDLLKLSADKATSFEEAASAADDIWALGTLIVQSLTRKPPKIEHDWAPFILREASEPYIDVVRNCLESNPHLRWTVNEVAARLNLTLVDVKLVSAPPPEAPAPVRKQEAVKEPAPLPTDSVPPPRVAEEPRPFEQVAAPEQPKPVEQVATRPVIKEPATIRKPIVDQDPVVDEPVFDDPVLKETKPEPALPDQDRQKLFVPEEAGSPASKKKWIYGGIAALVVAGALVGIGREKGSAPVAVASDAPVTQSAPAQPPTNPHPSPIPQSSSPQPAEPQRSERRGLPAPDHPKGATSRQAGRRADGWSVVVASYVSRAPAEKRAHEMTRRWPRFNASVFEQKAGKTFYLVVIGQNLSEDQANALRKRAVASGLPRDTYVKRFL